ncbi:hypothetical protein GCM10022419_018890 [Nonomuraea rosea]|uniref:Uncharacterized protein n=1 Tax=Nonomuraea rosea TaxID=638574 RepID=A0ABP6VU11_9ACTN
MIDARPEGSQAVADLPGFCPAVERPRAAGRLHLSDQTRERRNPRCASLSVSPPQWTPVVFPRR